MNRTQGLGHAAAVNDSKRPNYGTRRAALGREDPFPVIFPDSREFVKRDRPSISVHNPAIIICQAIFHWRLAVVPSYVESHVFGRSTGYLGNSGTVRCNSKIAYGFPFDRAGEGLGTACFATGVYPAGPLSLSEAVLPSDCIRRH